MSATSGGDGRKRDSRGSYAKSVFDFCCNFNGVPATTRFSANAGPPVIFGTRIWDQVHSVLLLAAGSQL
jgi:hypothetical protein